MTDLSLFRLLLRAVFFLGLSHGNFVSAEEPRISSWTCEINARFATESSSNGARQITLSGRGLASCKNTQKYDFNMPVRLTLTLKAKSGEPTPSYGNPAIAVNSVEPFVLTRSADEVLDRFTPFEVSSDAGEPHKKQLRLAGAKQKLILVMSLASSAPNLDKYDVQSILIEKDELTPSFALRGP